MLNGLGLKLHTKQFQSKCVNYPIIVNNSLEHKALITVASDRDNDQQTSTNIIESKSDGKLDLTASVHVSDNKASKEVSITVSLDTKYKPQRKKGLEEESEIF